MMEKTDAGQIVLSPKLMNRMWGRGWVPGLALSDAVALRVDDQRGVVDEKVLCVMQLLLYGRCGREIADEMGLSLSSCQVVVATAWVALQVALRPLVDEEGLVVRPDPPPYYPLTVEELAAHLGAAEGQLTSIVQRVMLAGGGVRSIHRLRPRRGTALGVFIRVGAPITVRGLLSWADELANRLGAIRSQRTLLVAKRLVADELTYKDLAQELGISRAGISYHWQKLLDVLGIRLDRTEAAWSLRWYFSPPAAMGWWAWWTGEQDVQREALVSQTWETALTTVREVFGVT